MPTQIGAFFAHSENSKAEKHALSHHLLSTAQRMAAHALDPETKPLFYFTGLMHDLGKYQPEFQTYLLKGGKRGSVPHAAWGAGYARIHKLNEPAFAIDGHHKGLPDRTGSHSLLEDTDPFFHKDVTGFETVVQTFKTETRIDEIELQHVNPKIWQDRFQQELFTRYLFSSLTDSDWLSTEAHFEPDITNARESRTLPIDTMIQLLDAHLQSKNSEGEINRLRNLARQEVLKKSDLPSGFFSLALPTGLGKTLTSMAWALRHADANKFKRIFIVLPYTNIIDQTSATLKSIFGEEWVLEHHSGYNEDPEATVSKSKPTTDTDFKLLEYRKKLATENWDFPIIVTTTVQFFESLFSSRPSKARKVHNIAESVVIFDEVQTLPMGLISPTLQMLKDMNAVMKTSFLFCTATQPAFETRDKFKGIDSITPLIADPKVLYEKTKRVRYQLANKLEPLSETELFNLVQETDTAALVIFNTKKAALTFFELVQKSQHAYQTIYHLLTFMCPAHRKAVIAQIRADLKNEKKILVASTQLIEAGVDFDFPVVFRAIAPMESIIQSAGRCNREGKIPNQGGYVFLFRLEDNGMPPGLYSTCAGHAVELIRDDLEKLHEQTIFTEYYAQVVSLYVDSNKNKINENRGKFNFETVNNSYHLIDNETESLYCYNFSPESRALFHALEHKEFLSREDFRNMQQYTVQVYPNFIFKNHELCPKTAQGFRVWYGNYNPETGISVAPIEADQLIV